MVDHYNDHFYLFILVLVIRILPVGIKNNFSNFLNSDEVLAEFCKENDWHPDGENIFIRNQDAHVKSKNISEKITFDSKFVVENTFCSYMISAKNLRKQPALEVFVRDNCFCFMISSNMIAIIVKISFVILFCVVVIKNSQSGFHILKVL